MAVYQPQGSWKAPQKSKINPGTTRKITDEGYDELKDPAKQTPKSNSESERDDSGVDVEEEHARFRPTKKTRTKKLVNWRDVIVNQEDKAQDPKTRPWGKRLVLDCTEDETRNHQEWPINIRRREQERASQSQEGHTQPPKKDQKADKSQQQSSNNDKDGVYDKPSPGDQTVFEAESAQYNKDDVKLEDSKALEGHALQKDGWMPSALLERNWITDDTAVYKFKLPENTPYMGVGTCQHVEFAFHLRDKMLVRPYGPTKPVFPRGSGVEVGEDRSLHDGCGTFEITVKTYFPDEEQPGGAFSNILANIPVGEQVDMRGPRGDVVYQGRGRFSVSGGEKHFRRASLVLGGTGLSPGFALLARSILDPQDETELLVLDGNKTESDILLHDELNHLESISNGRLKITHVLSEASDEWKGLTGFIDKDMMAKHLFPPSEDNLALLCGPPVMIEKVVGPGLKDLGYVEGVNMVSL